jgi:hypothetical protein
MIMRFKTFLKEQESDEKYYTLNLYDDMTKEEIIYYMNQLLSLTLKLVKSNRDVLVTVEPISRDKND